MRREGLALAAVALGACAHIALTQPALAGPHDALIAKHAEANGVPEDLVRRVIKLESGGNARASHAGNYGLMQIRLGTARGVGYSGDVDGLLDPDTNLTYAVKYLAGAYRVAGCDADRAVKLYRSGYYGVAPSSCRSPAVQLAQADTRNESRARRGAKPRPAAEAADKPADVIKPKAVRTEAIGPKPAAAPARPAGSFEPVRTTPSQPQYPPPQQAAAAKSNTPTAGQKTDRLKHEAPKGAPVQAAAPAAYELASVPLPPVRREIEPAKPQPKPAKPALRAEKRSAPAEKESSKLATVDATAVVSFVKNLVMPDDKKKSRKRGAAASGEASPPKLYQPLP